MVRVSSSVTAFTTLACFGGLLYILLYVASSQYSEVPEVTWVHNVDDEKTEYRHARAILSMQDLDSVFIQLGFVHKPKLYPQVKVNEVISIFSQNEKTHSFSNVKFYLKLFRFSIFLIDFELIVFKFVNPI